MVPQPNMYEGVCRKFVTLPVVPNATNKFVSRRLVCDALISMTKGVKGPVHIDVPLQFISRREPAAYRLKNEYKKIDYVDYRTDDIKWVDIIKKMRDSKIAVIYGQNPVVSKEFVEKLNTFADRFNCVIAKEHISNINCKKSVNMFNMLKAKNLNHDMIMAIKPNIVITVNAGTATITRDFVQRYKYNIEHWDIIENGNVEDPYRKLTRVFVYDFNSFIDKGLIDRLNHVLNSDYSEIRVIGAGADAVDIALINLCQRDDIVVTQDYGVAALALGKGAKAIHQSGRWYTDENIDGLLMERHMAKVVRRRSKNHLKGPAKRIDEDDRRFEESFRRLIESCLQQKPTT